MKSEGVSAKKKREGLYGTPFQATTWAVEIREISPGRFRWIAIHRNVSMMADNSIDDRPFKTAEEAYKDFLSLMKAQAICLCSKKVVSCVRA